jgi:hypothetical protein
MRISPRTSLGNNSGGMAHQWGGQMAAVNKRLRVKHLLCRAGSLARWMSPFPCGEIAKKSTSLFVQTPATSGSMCRISHLISSVFRRQHGGRWYLTCTSNSAGISPSPGRTVSQLQSREW